MAVCLGLRSSNTKRVEMEKEGVREVPSFKALEKAFPPSGTPRAPGQPNAPDHFHPSVLGGAGAGVGGGGTSPGGASQRPTVQRNPEAR